MDAVEYWQRSGKSLIHRFTALSALSSLLYETKHFSRDTTGGASPCRLVAFLMTKTRLSTPRSLLYLLSFQRCYHLASSSSSSSSPISALAADLLSLPDPIPNPEPLLESYSFPSLLRSSRKSSASMELFSLLKHRPLLALEVFSWRRKIATGPDPIPLSSVEYSKAITLAGRARNVDLAASLFYEAIVSFPEAALYNALMSAYMYNGMMGRCLATFQILKEDRRCKPTIVSYNILLSLFGNNLLVDHMETVLHAADEAGMIRTLKTHNAIISAYVTAFMWDRMESTYQAMLAGPVKPGLSTHLLMLRGYAHSGNIEKMEDTYRIVSRQVQRVDAILIKAMICAYCKSSCQNRIQRIEELLECISDAEYRPWLHVILIRAYAQEGLVEVMERLIDEAFRRNTAVTSRGIMYSIISSYYRRGAIDQLAGFVKSAEEAGWKLSHSVFHCKMTMYGKCNRLEEMHEVLNEMEIFRFHRTKRTFLIMHRAYYHLGRRLEANTVIGLMWKLGLAGLTDGPLLPYLSEPA